MEEYGFLEVIVLVGNGGKSEEKCIRSCFRGLKGFIYYVKKFGFVLLLVGVMKRF